MTKDFPRSNSDYSTTESDNGIIGCFPRSDSCDSISSNGSTQNDVENTDILTYLKNIIRTTCNQVISAIYACTTITDKESEVIVKTLNEAPPSARENSRNRLESAAHNALATSRVKQELGIKGFNSIGNGERQTSSTPREGDILTQHCTTDMYSTTGDKKYAAMVRATQESPRHRR